MYYKISIKPLNLYGKGGIVMKKTNLKCTDTASTESSSSEADVHNYLKPKTKTASARVLFLFVFCALFGCCLLCKTTNTTKKYRTKCTVFAGGDSRSRTGDLLNAIQTLYQMSYTPTA